MRACLADRHSPPGVFTTLQPARDLHACRDGGKQLPATLANMVANAYSRCLRPMLDVEAS